MQDKSLRMPHLKGFATLRPSCTGERVWSRRLVNAGSKDRSSNFLTMRILLAGWNHLDLRMRYESPGFFGGFLISSMNSWLVEKALAMRVL